jgi:hypothetical protein
MLKGAAVTTPAQAHLAEIEGLERLLKEASETRPDTAAANALNAKFRAARKDHGTSQIASEAAMNTARDEAWREIQQVRRALSPTQDTRDPDPPPELLSAVATALEKVTVWRKETEKLDRV